MADVEAPLAQLENEEWQDFNDLRILTGLNFCQEDVDGFLVDNGGITDGCGSDRLPSRPLLLDNSSCSLGDNISKCFRIDTTNRADEAPTILQSQNDVLVNNQIWHQISESFDNALPVEWSRSYAHQLQENSLNLQETMGVSEVVQGLDMSDDEELHQAMDLHCLILSSQDDEPILTADEVISELEEMMEEDLDCNETYVPLDGPSKTAQLIRNKLKQAVTPGSTVKDCLQKMTSSDLYTLHEELDCTIREYSEVLVHELASREELEFQKELNNQFISLILSIQKKRREMETEKKKSGGKMPPAKTKEYLTTVIPYDHHQGTPDADRLQIYIKILTAINEDNSTVPLLLTDYILNVLCPKT